MRLRLTPMDRTGCLMYHQGYTEYNGNRYVIDGNYHNAPVLSGNHIIFSYEYDRNGAETGFDKNPIELFKMVNSISPLTKINTLIYGGYISSQGVKIEEHGIMLTFDDKVSPIDLGAIARKIAELFRQESVLVVHKDEVSFVYA